MKHELRILLPPFEPGEQYRYLWCLNRDQPIPLFALKPGDQVIVIREEEVVEEKAVEQKPVSVAAVPTEMPNMSMPDQRKKREKKYPGVYAMENGRYYAMYRNKYLGAFDTEEDAWQAKCAALEHHATVQAASEEPRTEELYPVAATDAFQRAYNVTTGREES